MTVQNCIDACTNKRYVLFTYPHGTRVGFNARLTNTQAFKRQYDDTSQETDFIGFRECTFNEYINHKASFV
jgi:hypothetical protein